MTDFPSSPETETVPELKRVEMLVCTACLDGIGEECHTPGCSMFLHSVDLPFPKDTYREVTDFAPTPTVSRDQLVKTIRSKARVAGHDAWEGGYYHLANADEIADAIIALSQSSTLGNTR